MKRTTSKLNPLLFMVSDFLISTKSIKIEKGSGKPNMEKVAKITKAQVKEIAEQKMPDLNAASIETAMSMVEGTARSMGVVVID